MTSRAADTDGSIPLAPGERPTLVLHPAAGDESDEGGLELSRVLAGELPDPATLAPGSWVALDAGPAPPKKLFGLLGGRRRGGVHLAVRCTALLARGYTDICADESGMAFGRVPRD